MKYVNHMSSSVEDEKHEALIDKAGLAGYGAYWIVAEKIAAQIRPEQVATSLALSWRNWARHLRTSTQKAQFLLRSAHAVGLIILTEQAGIAKVDMPNILKYADEYTKRVGIPSGHAREKLPRDSGTPALPALPEVQDLRAREAGGFDGPPLAAPEPAPTERPPKKARDVKDRCHAQGCTRRGDVPGNDGKWYCDQHDHPEPPPPTSPPPGNGAGKEENRTTVSDCILGLHLTPTKSESIAPLYLRHQERPIPNDEIASQLLGAGLDANEVFRAAQVFFRKQ